MKNIEINYLDVSGYEVLYPKTTTENLIDFGEVLYTKEEVDGFIAELDNRIDNQIGALRFTYGGYVGQFSSYDISLGGNTKATNWQIITLGFKPIGLILSYENSFDTDSVSPKLVGASYEHLGDLERSYTVGFTLPITVDQYIVAEALDTGFRIRALTGTGSDENLNMSMVYLNDKYNYLAFG